MLRVQVGRGREVDVQGVSRVVGSEHLQQITHTSYLKYSLSSLSIAIFTTTE